MSLARRCTSATSPRSAATKLALPPSGSDFLDRLGAARGVAAVNQDLRPVPGQLQRDCATDARRRARDKRPLPFEVVLTHG